MGSKPKKNKPHQAPDFNIALRPEEKILHTAHPGRPAELFFLVPAIVCFVLAPALIFTTVWAFIKDYVPGGSTSVTIAGALILFGVYLIIQRFIVMNRFYLITNERVIVTKGRGRKSQMFLNIEDVYGVSISQSLLYRIFRLADIDFHSPSSQPRTKTFLIISFTSTVFKFSFLSHKEGVEAFRLLEQLVGHNQKSDKN